MKIDQRHREELIRLLRSCKRHIEYNFGTANFSRELENYALRLEKYELPYDRSAMVRLALRLLEAAELAQSRVVSIKQSRPSAVIARIEEALLMLEKNSTPVRWKSVSRLVE